MPSSNSRAIHECASHAEAEVLKGYLAGFDIHASYEGDDSTGLTGRYRAMRGVSLRVPAEDAERARELIAEADFSVDAEEAGEAGDWRDAYAQEMESPEEAPSREPETCPNCGGARVHPEQLPRWLNMLLLGLPTLFGRNTWACADCGWLWHP